jgi:prepilin-type N-terminal cleavage/methylation domain-containing protein
MAIKNKTGFTLIEVIIYIALFTILMVGAFVTAYQLLQGSDTLSGKAVTQDEINFVLRKIDWALNGTSSSASLIIPSATTLSSSTLSFIRPDGNKIDFQLNTASSSIEMKESVGANIFLPITTNNVKVTSLGFRYIPSIGIGAPVGVEATTTINGITATTTKYFRK